MSKSQATVSRTYKEASRLKVKGEAVVTCLAKLEFQLLRDEAMCELTTSKVWVAEYNEKCKLLPDKGYLHYWQILHRSTQWLMPHQISFLLRDLQLRAQEASEHGAVLANEAKVNALNAKMISRSFFRQRAFNRLSNRLKAKYMALHNAIAADPTCTERQQEVERIAKNS